MRSPAREPPQGRLRGKSQQSRSKRPSPLAEPTSRNAQSRPPREISSARHGYGGQTYAPPMADKSFEDRIVEAVRAGVEAGVYEAVKDSFIEGTLQMQAIAHGIQQSMPSKDEILHKIELGTMSGTNAAARRPPS